MPRSERVRPWLALLGLILGVCVTNGFARFAYGLLLPAMQADLGWSYAQAGWLNTANALGYIGGALLTMVLIRRAGPARLFAFGMVTTAVALTATGQDPALWWQTLWRVLAGFFGAMSFATAGALAAQLFRDDPRRNALAIALLFGAGGGIGIVLAGAVLPLLLDRLGPAAWPMAWTLIGLVCFAFLPLGLWSAHALRPARLARAPEPQPLPIRQMLPQIGGYAGFGLGYIVYLTFLSAWMTELGARAELIALVWVLLGLCLCLSPFLWRPVLARFATGLPLALILVGVATGSLLPVLWPGGLGLAVSAAVFGLCVFMAPGAVTSFLRQNLPPDSWGPGLSLFTVVFAVAQTLGPFGAGLIGDLAQNIGVSLAVAAAVLLCGAGSALLQRRLAAPD